MKHDKLIVVVTEHDDLSAYLDHDDQGRTYLATLQGWPQVADGPDATTAVNRLLQAAGLNPGAVVYESSAHA